MKLKVERFHKNEICSIGKLYIDGVFFCFTLEDCEREIDGEPVELWKIPNITAIPKGEYKIRMTFSNRFQKILPELIAVPGFLGVRIHPGNTAENTEGCILVGDSLNSKTNSIGYSRAAFNRLFLLIEKQKNLSIVIS